MANSGGGNCLAQLLAAAAAVLRAVAAGPPPHADAADGAQGPSRPQQDTTDPGQDLPAHLRGCRPSLGGPSPRGGGRSPHATAASALTRPALRGSCSCGTLRPSAGGTLGTSHLRRTQPGRTTLQLCRRGDQVPSATSRARRLARCYL